MADNDSRLRVLGVGLTVRGKAISTYDQNPHQFRDKEGNIIETTKLTIENLPVSISDNDLISHLKSKGVEPTSELDWVNCRDFDHSLKRNWFNGDRFLYIRKPTYPLPEYTFIGKFKAFLSHQEQLTQIPCSNCLEFGHRARRCRNQVVCLDCKEKGHRKGHHSCSKTLIKKMPESKKSEKEEGELSENEETLSQDLDSDSEAEVTNESQIQPSMTSVWEIETQTSKDNSESKDKKLKISKDQVEHKIVEIPEKTNNLAETEILKLLNSIISEKTSQSKDNEYKPNSPAGPNPVNDSDKQSVNGAEEKNFEEPKENSQKNSSTQSERSPLDKPDTTAAPNSEKEASKQTVNGAEEKNFEVIKENSQ